LVVSPSSVNTASGPATITVTAHVTDVGLGVGATDQMLAALRWTAPSGGQFLDAAYYGSVERISGNDNDGYYRTTMTMPQGAANGAWTLDSVIVYDRVGNSGWYNADELTTAGLDRPITNG
jgi:hypothetical protein